MLSFAKDAKKNIQEKQAASVKNEQIFTENI